MRIDKPFNNADFGIYQLGSLLPLSIDDLGVITTSLKLTNSRGSKGLEGRMSVRKVNLAQYGPVVIKEYRRGGILGKFIKNWHVYGTTSRSQQEFVLLTEVAKLGVNVPKPICFVHTRGFLYSAWLVTEEIKESKSLAELARTNEHEARRVATLAAYEIGKLIKAKILHVDLHPGNVLLGSNNKVYLIDFDKADYYRGHLRELRDYYLCRWRRACLKHGLPEYIYEIMSLELLQYQAWDSNLKETDSK